MRQVTRIAEDQRPSWERLKDPPKSAREPIRFLLGKWRGRRNARLHRDDVRDIRRWARREGYGLLVAYQAWWLRTHWYPTLSQEALCEVLRNQTWYDPTYEHNRPDPAWMKLTPILCMLLVLRLHWSDNRRALKEKAKCA